MSEPKPVAWLIRTCGVDEVYLTLAQAQSRAVDALELDGIRPLYPGPFRVEFAADSGTGTLDATSERWLAVSWIARDGGRLMRRLVSEWEPDRE